MAEIHEESRKEMTGKGLTGDARLTADAGIWLPASLSVSVKRRMDFLLFHALFFGLCHLHNPGFRFPPFFMLSAAFPCCLMPLPPSHTAFPISMRILDFHLPWSAKKQRQLHPAAAASADGVPSGALTILWLFLPAHPSRAIPCSPLKVMPPCSPMYLQILLFLLFCT